MPDIWGPEYVYADDEDNEPIVPLDHNNGVVVGAILWILAKGVWNDDGIWMDNENWLDTLPVLEGLIVCKEFSGETETEVGIGCDITTTVLTIFVWILAKGVWNDDGIWMDNENWLDFPSADSLPILEDLIVCKEFSGETETEVVEATVKEGQLGITDCDVMPDIVPQEEAGIINTALGIGCGVITTILTIFVWILVEGIWNDDGIWMDNENWID